MGHAKNVSHKEHKALTFKCIFCALRVFVGDCIQTKISLAINIILQVGKMRGQLSIFRHRGPFNNARTVTC